MSSKEEVLSSEQALDDYFSALLEEELFEEERFEAPQEALAEEVDVAVEEQADFQLASQPAPETQPELEPQMQFIEPDSYSYAELKSAELEAPNLEDVERLLSQLEATNQAVELDIDDILQQNTAQISESDKIVDCDIAPVETPTAEDEISIDAVPDAEIDAEAVDDNVAETVTAVEEVQSWDFDLDAPISGMAVVETGTVETAVETITVSQPEPSVDRTIRADLWERVARKTATPVEDLTTEHDTALEAVIETDFLDEPMRVESTPEVTQPVIEPEPITETVIEETPDTQVELDTQAGGEHQKTWHSTERAEAFQVLYFEVNGVTFAVPLDELGGIHRLEELNKLIGRPQWYLGLQTSREQQLDVVDTAKWVMPEKLVDDSHREDYQYIVMLGASMWGLASSQLLGTEALGTEKVRWREQAGKRPWLAGMVKEKMCALIHVEALIDMLNAGLDVKSMK